MQHDVLLKIRTRIEGCEPLERSGFDRKSGTREPGQSKEEIREMMSLPPKMRQGLPGV